MRFTGATGAHGATGRDGRTGATGAEGRPGRDAPRVKAAARDRALPVAVVVLALLMGGQYVYLLSGVSQRAACESDERGRLGARSDDNQNKLILGVAALTARGDTVKPTPAQQAAARAEYRKLFDDFTGEARSIAAARVALAEGKVCG